MSIYMKIFTPLTK